MALNWAMLSEDGSRPVPLPGEKIFFSVEKCSMSLDFKEHGVKWTAVGNAFVTSKRILFLRQPPLPAPQDPSLSSMHLRSLSVPLAQFIETRYLIPIFTAPYFEASVIPSVDGSLPQPSRTAQGQERRNNVGLMKIWFNEGGGMAFRDAVEEVKSRLDEGSTHIEALPLYEPPAEGSSSRLPDLNTLQISDQQSTTSSRPRPPTRPQRENSMPNPVDLDAARVAREAEEQERDLERQRSQHREEQHGQNQATIAQEPDELPPPYPA